MQVLKRARVSILYATLTFLSAFTLNAPSALAATTFSTENSTLNLTLDESDVFSIFDYSRNWDAVSCYNSCPTIGPLTTVPGSFTLGHGITSQGGGPQIQMSSQAFWMPFPYFGTDPFSVVFTVATTSADPFDVVVQGPSLDNGSFFRVQIYGSVALELVGTNQPITRVVGTTKVNDGMPHLVVITRDSLSAIKIYVDGKLDIFQAASPINIDLAYDPLYLFSSPNTGEVVKYGEFSLYKIAFAESDVNSAWSTLISPTPTPTPTPTPVNCVVSSWSSFGACSASCGGGTQTQNRTVIVSPAFGGAACPALSQSQACNTQPCDSDGDGVPDSLDKCPGTPVGAKVDANGCSGAQLVTLACSPNGSWKNHGAYVSCVAQASDRQVQQGLLTPIQKGAITSAAGNSKIGK